jgi:hypothetical protein
MARIAGERPDVARAEDAAVRSPVQHAASSGGAGTADELVKLADLKAQEITTEAEFAHQNAKLLA